MPGTKHIEPGRDGKPTDFSELIAHAQKCPPPTEIEHGEIIGGFAHHQVIELAPKIIELVKEGKIRKFVVMAGCDGRMPSRDYYTKFAEAPPKDCVILVVPFCTHEGSGLSNTESYIADVCKGSTVAKGLAVRGETAQNNREQARKTVNRWIEQL